MAFGVGGKRDVRGRGVSRYRESGALFPGTSPATFRRVALPSARYQPRRPAEDVLYQIVQSHFETFLAQAADQSPALPRSARAPGGLAGGGRAARGGVDEGGRPRTEDTIGQDGGGEVDANTRDANRRRARGRLWRTS